MYPIISDYNAVHKLTEKVLTRSPITFSDWCRIKYFSIVAGQASFFVPVQRALHSVNVLNLLGSVKWGAGRV